MTRLTRDYKKSQRRALNPSRLREFALGVVIGAVLASAFVLYLTRSPQEIRAETPRPQPHRQPARSEDADPSEGGGVDSGESYDFYEMLPKFEVVVPEKDTDVKRDGPAGKIDRPGVYVLQAGSYRNFADASRVATQLHAQGIDAKVQRVAVDADVWHRVRIGPIKDLAEVNRVRAQLQAADIDGLVIRVGD